MAAGTSLDPLVLGLQMRNCRVVVIWARAGALPQSLDFSPWPGPRDGIPAPRAVLVTLGSFVACGTQPWLSRKRNLSLSAQGPGNVTSRKHKSSGESRLKRQLRRLGGTHFGTSPWAAWLRGGGRSGRDLALALGRDSLALISTVQFRASERRWSVGFRERFCERPQKK